MVRCVVISIRLGRNVAGYLKQRPEVGAELINAIITRIDACKTVKLSQHQVRIVLGKLCTEEEPDKETFWQRRTMTYDQYYILDGNSRIAKTMDKRIRSIVNWAAQFFIARFYMWETGPKMPASN